MKIAELITTEKPQAPLSLEKARVRAMKQGIARQKAALAAEKERQHDVRHAKKMNNLRDQTM